MVEKVLAIPGDGIGVEVMTAALEVVGPAGIDWDLIIRDDINTDLWMRTGETLDPQLLEDLGRGRYAAILFGAIGSPDAPEGVVERATLLRLRFCFQLSLNVRPLRLPERLSSPLASGQRIDAVCVRENTEGAYVGVDGALHRDTDDEVATTVSLSTRRGAERAMRHGFELARGRRRQVTLVHKANVLSAEGSLWKRVGDAVSRDFPDVSLVYSHADAAAMKLVTHPEQFDVIVTDNLFGDLLTDIGAALAGGIGLAASSNINPKTNLALFEPVHGSAPDIVGQGLADPTAMIRCVAMCARHLGNGAAADRIDKAIDAAIDPERKPSTTGQLEAVLGNL
ncbi:isocitrate/isopropylmalate dehydrogenase family protein [Mycolicibacterium sp.]|uniref:isocitrate/isopropylmalate dehydrogenase family protein n=1 Tax=Mycolicibacterium sp. TaxID=2320850 RepID=UPI0037CBC818